MEAKHYQNGSHEVSKKLAPPRPSISQAQAMNVKGDSEGKQPETWFIRTNNQLNELENTGDALLKQGRKYFTQIEKLIRDHPLTAIALASAATAVTVYAVMKLTGGKSMAAPQTAKT